MRPSVTLALMGLIGPTLAIVGGTAAEQLQFPYMASVQRSGHHFCGGVLVNASIVLTTANCANAITASTAGVRLGINNVRVPDAGSEVWGVKQIIIHEHYDYRSHLNDLAILWLTGVSTLTPAKLATSAPQVGDEVTLVGWGTNKEGTGTRDYLSLTTVPIISRSDCQAAIDDEEIPTTVLCDMTPGGGRGACFGDGGGPVIGKDGAVAGIIAHDLWDQSCGSLPDVSVDLVQYKTWIAKNSPTSALVEAPVKKQDL